MSFEIIITLCIIFIAIVLFVTERISVDSVSIIVMALFMITGVLNAEEGFSGFSNPATVTVAAMFVLSEALFRTGALSSVGRLLTMAGKKSLSVLLLSIMGVSGFLSAFINDTAVVALFMPIVIQVARETRISPSKLLMPLSFGALFGGCCTLIGTSTNILVSSIAEKMGEPALGMFDFTPFGLFVLAVGSIYMVLVGHRLIPSREDKGDLADSYGMGDYLTEIVLLPNSLSVGQSIQNSPLVKEVDIDIISIRRQDIRIHVEPYTVLAAGDHLQVRCDVENLRKLRNRVGIELKPEMKFKLKESLTDTILAEAIIIPNSDLVDQTLREIRFRDVYNANVLAIRHRHSIRHEKLGSTKLKAGDVLLMTIAIDRIRELKQNKNLVVVSDQPTEVFRTNKVIPALAIIAGVVLCAATNLLSIVVASVIGCILMVAIGALKLEETYKSIQWKVIFLLAGVLSMGVALEKTGAAAMLSSFLIDHVGQYGPRALLSVFFLVTLAFTNFMSNNASAALMAPIAIITAHSFGVSAKPFLMAVTYAASLSFMTPVGYQTNTMIYGPGNYRFTDYLRVGTPLDILLWILGTLLIPYFFPF